MKYCYIYKITNPKGKIYIGQTDDIITREKSYKYIRCYGQHKVYNSLKKYGWENHKWEIIYKTEFTTQEELDRLEIFFVAFFKSNIRRFKDGYGMNLTDGGGGMRGYTHSEETKRKISKVHKGKKVPNWIIEKAASKTRVPIIQMDKNWIIIKQWGSISEACQFLDLSVQNVCKVCRGETNTAGGYRWKYAYNDEVYEQKRANRLKDKYSCKMKSILQYDLEGNFIKEWEGSSVAAKELGFDRNSIISCLKGRYNYSFGYRWIYKDSNIRQIKSPIRLGKSIIQYNINGQFLKEFPSILIASKETGISRGNITHCLRGRQSISGGFKWTYSNEKQS